MLFVLQWFEIWLGKYLECTGRADWQIIVLLDPESNDGPSIAVQDKAPAVLHLSMVPKRLLFLFCCGWSYLIRPRHLIRFHSVKRIVSRWWHLFWPLPCQWWSHWLGTFCSNVFQAEVLPQVLPRSQESARNMSNAPWGSLSRYGRTKFTSHGLL